MTKHNDWSQYKKNDDFMLTFVLLESRNHIKLPMLTAGEPFSIHGESVLNAVPSCQVRVSFVCLRPCPIKCQSGCHNTWQNIKYNVKLGLQYISTRD